MDVILVKSVKKRARGRKGASGVGMLMSDDASLDDENDATKSVLPLILLEKMRFGDG